MRLYGPSYLRMVYMIDQLMTHRPPMSAAPQDLFGRNSQFRTTGNDAASAQRGEDVSTCAESLHHSGLTTWVLLTPATGRTLGSTDSSQNQSFWKFFFLMTPWEQDELATGTNVEVPFLDAAQGCEKVISLRLKQAP